MLIKILISEEEDIISSNITIYLYFFIYKIK